jgi:hypothetical protein
MATVQPFAALLAPLFFAHMVIARAGFQFRVR